MYKSVKRNVFEPKNKFNPFPFAFQEEVTITITDITNLGSGVGRKKLENGTEWVIMVPLVLPGEVVTVKVSKNYASYSEASLVSILTVSPDRITPQCKYFTSCGGCQYQHMSITAQRHWKWSQVKDSLQRIGHLTDVNVSPVIGTSELYGYRSKLTPHYDRKHANQDAAIGFLQRGTKHIVDITDCIIATDNIRASFNKMRTELKATILGPGKSTKDGATLLFRETDDGNVERDYRRNVTQTVGGILFRYKAGEFFQNNPFLLPALVEHVLRQATATGSNKCNAVACSYLIDAYCGSGLFALSCAASFREVFGVEVSHQAVAAATDNAARNKITNAKFLCGPAGDIFSKVMHLPRDETVMVLDPPRSGCDEPFLQQLYAFGPRRVVYVSCDPATQARDAKGLVAAGYSVVDVTPFDLFPQTRHIESVMTFERR
jgi:23S rRNA (uracil1939-C5)-methyltransferase/tRNA (uracil-5-)-methyltransferase